MGKSSIIYVVGLIVVLTYLMTVVQGSVSSSVDTMVDYRTRVMVHNAAVAGANLGTHRVLMNGELAAEFTGTMQGIPFTVVIDSLNPGGDRRVTSVAQMDFAGIFGSAAIRDTVIASFRHVQFARFAYFSGAEQNGYMSPTSNVTSGVSMWKVTGDSLFGYAHTNTHWNLGGRPYFENKVTAFNPPNTMLYGGVYDPIFNGGTQWGITVPRPTVNLTRLETIASTTGALVDGKDVGLEFFPDGRVHVKIPATTGSTREDTVAMGALAPSGVFAVRNADIRVKGVYQGQLTLTALTGTSSSGLKGNIWIDGNLLANTPPRSNPSSADMLGLVAERMTYLTTKDPVTGILIPRDPSSIVNIEAAIYCQNGVFGVQDYDAVPVSGRYTIFGSLTMAASTSSGTLSGGVLAHGYLKSIAHDPRYLTSAPPSFPVSTKFELVSWWEL